MSNLRFVSPERDRHGRTRYRFRAPWARCVMKSRDPDTAEFRAEYAALIARERTAPTRTAPGRGSFAWLVAQYKSSAEFRALHPDTRKQRANFLDRIAADHGHRAAHLMTPDAVRALRNTMSDRPGAARNMLQSLSALFTWAGEAGHGLSNPTIGVKRPPQTRTGFRPWKADHILQFRARHPVGTRARLALELMIWHGLRRGDLVTLGRQHRTVIDGEPWHRIKQEKTGRVLESPINPDLDHIIAASPTGDLAYLVTDYGQPFKKTGFGARFKKWVIAADLPPDLAAHGVRKGMAELLGESGCTELEIMALLGHETPSEGATYTRDTNRRRLSSSAFQKLKLSTPTRGKLSTPG